MGSCKTREEPLLTVRIRLEGPLVVTSSPCPPPTDVNETKNPTQLGLGIPEGIPTCRFPLYSQAEAVCVCVVFTFFHVAVPFPLWEKNKDFTIPYVYTMEHSSAI